MAGPPLTGETAKPLAEAKAALRKRMIALRDVLEPAARQQIGDHITRQITAMPAYREAVSVLAYCSFGSEFPTAGLISEVLASGRRLILPRVERGLNELVLYAVKDISQDMAMGPWGIREPVPERCELVSIDAPHFVLVPGLAFTARGDRLGYGKGYYDRLIRNMKRRPHRPSLVAAAFPLQVLPEVPCGPLDEQVDRVVTA